MSDKTEEPTPRRLRKAAEQGDSPVSGALTQAAALMVALALLPAIFEVAAGEVGAALQRAIAERQAEPLLALGLLLRLLSPLLALLAAVTAGGGLLQTGGTWSSARLRPDFSRIEPFRGLLRLFSLERLSTLLRSLLAALLLSLFAYQALVHGLAEAASTTGSPAVITQATWSIAQPLLWKSASVTLALGVIDVWFVRKAWRKRNRMSKDEVKREYRESDGNPEVKAARKRAHAEALMGTAIAAVKNATVLVVNPTHLAMALRYDESEDEAPRVIAQGEGELAERMVAAAHAYGVPVVRDVPIAHALRDLELGEEIPEALYEAVADVLRELFANAEAGAPPPAGLGVERGADTGRPSPRP